MEDILPDRKIAPHSPDYNWVLEVENEEAREKVAASNMSIGEEDKCQNRSILASTDARSGDNKRKRQESDSQGCEQNKKSHGSRNSLDNIETNALTLERRQKTIDYGKNTVGYTNYRKLVPLEKRTKEHPRTPDKYYKYSRRSWDHLIKVWRKELHLFDPKPKGDTKEDNDNSF